MFQSNYTHTTNTILKFRTKKIFKWSILNNISLCGVKHSLNSISKYFQNKISHNIQMEKALSVKIAFIYLWYLRLNIFFSYYKNLIFPLFYCDFYLQKYETNFLWILYESSHNHYSKNVIDHFSVVWFNKNQVWMWKNGFNILYKFNYFIDGIIETYTVAVWKLMCACESRDDA